MNTIAAADRTHPRRAERAPALLVGPAGTAAVFMDGCGGGVGKGGGEGGAGGELQAFMVHRLTVPGTVA